MLLLGINYLSKKYSHVRKVRGDGNCFYRAFLFCYLENLLTSHLSNDAKDQEKAETERIRMIMLIHNSMQDLTTVGYSENAVDMFQEVEFFTLYLYNSATVIISIIILPVSNSYASV